HRQMKKSWIVILASLSCLLVVFAAPSVFRLAVASVFRSGATRPMDNQFGDQFLKTTVALVELHKVRFGTYPAKLSDLEFVGDWDRLPLASFSYCPSADRKSYFVQAARGWIGKPDITPPAGFWQGTGYNPQIGPCR